jgi:DNA processing protein
MNDEKKGIRLSDSQRLSWLRLIRSENVGPATFRDLIVHCGSASDVLEMLPELVRRGGGGRPIRIASLQDAEREMQAAAKMGAVFVGIGEPDYPRYLRQCDNPPPLVAIKGNPRCSGYRPLPSWAHATHRWWGSSLRG